MTILVTGAAGFLGVHLCEGLLKRGETVLGLDNLSTGQERNRDFLLEYPGFSFLHADVTQPIETTVDRIFHLACPASPPHYQRDPISTTKTAVFGTLNVLELAERTGARVVIASTSEVYGDPLRSPQVETDWGNVNPIGIRACYDEGKRIGETLAFDFFRTRSVDVRVARIFNTYGPRMDPKDGRVVSNFIVASLQNEPLTIYGDGSQTRSFCYVADLIRGLYALMAVPENPGQPVNIGNPEELTVRDAADLIRRLVDSTSEVTHSPLPSDDPTRRCPDISAAKRLLNWSPEWSFEAGLKATIPYFASLQ